MILLWKRETYHAVSWEGRATTYYISANPVLPARLLLFLRGSQFIFNSILHANYFVRFF